MPTPKTPTTTVGIAGLTSKFARNLAFALLTHPHIQIKGLCRTPSKLPPSLLHSPRITLYTGTPSDTTTVSAFVSGTEIVVCSYYGSELLMTTGQIALIDACVAHNVPRYLASDFAVDYTRIPDGEVFPKTSAKTVKRYLEGTRVAGVHVLVGALMETFWSSAFGVYDDAVQSLLYWGSGEEKWDFSSFEMAAKFTAALVMDPGAKGVFKFRGDRISIKQIAKLYQHIYATPLTLVRRGSLDNLYHSYHKTYQLDPGNVAAWAPACFQYWCTCGVAALGDSVDNSRYPAVVPTTLEAFLRARKKEDLALAEQALGV